MIPVQLPLTPNKGRGHRWVEAVLENTASRDPETETIPPHLNGLSLLVVFVQLNINRRRVYIWTLKLRQVPPIFPSIYILCWTFPSC